jgi:hypothetical protein
MDTHTNSISRRDLSLYCMGGLAIAFAPIAAATMAQTADKGEQPFQLWKTMRQQINAAPDADMDNGNDAVRWNVVDRLEGAILADATATPRAAERKLWLALTHETSIGTDDEACIREDLAHFIRQGDALDWNVRLLVASIATLRRAQEAA